MGMCVENAGAVDSSLCMLARKLLVMLAFSAATERIFSNFCLIQTKLRNKLGIQKCECGKLVFCDQMLRGKGELHVQSMKNCVSIV